MLKCTRLMVTALTRHAIATVGAIALLAIAPVAARAAEPGTTCGRAAD